MKASLIGEPTRCSEVLSHCGRKCNLCEGKGILCDEKYLIFVGHGLCFLLQITNYQLQFCNLLLSEENCRRFDSLGDSTLHTHARVHITRSALAQHP